MVDWSLLDGLQEGGSPRPWLDHLAEEGAFPPEVVSALAAAAEPPSPEVRALLARTTNAWEDEYYLPRRWWVLADDLVLLWGTWQWAPESSPGYGPERLTPRREVLAFVRRLPTPPGKAPAALLVPLELPPGGVLPVVGPLDAWHARLGGVPCPYGPEEDDP